MKTNFFKLGLFIISAAFLFAAAVIVLGAGVLFREEKIVETYFVESVQGLDIGSPLKFRGVQIGNVKEITLAAREYETGHRYVLVRSALYSDALNLKRAPVDIREEVKDGLRVRLAIQGVTGAVYLEADYFSPERYAPLEIDWDPDTIYIPSAPSTITRLGDALDSIMKNLQAINFQGISVSLQQSLQSLSEILAELNLQTIDEDIQKLLGELRETNRAVNDLVSGDISEGLAQAENAFKRLDFLISSQQNDIETTIDNFRSASEDLKEVMENAKRYPSQIFFGEPPPRSAPGTR